MTAIDLTAARTIYDRRIDAANQATCDNLHNLAYQLRTRALDTWIETVNAANAMAAKATRDERWSRNLAATRHRRAAS